MLANIKKISLDFCIGGAIGLTITLISFFLFYSNSIEKPVVDHSLLKIYMELWDGHRNQHGIIHYEYLIKTLFLFVIFNTYYLLQTKKQMDFLRRPGLSNESDVFETVNTPFFVLSGDLTYFTNSCN